MKKNPFIILAIFVQLISCTSTSLAENKNAEVNIVETTNKNEPAKLLYKGEELVIAVTSPEIRNTLKTDEWLPQYFQDSLTGNFARYSRMKVLDRKNESLIKAEQELSESGYYAEENAVQIGQLTNASLVMVGSIQKISNSYEINFRINDIATNEIKASFTNRYSLTDLQNGKAVNEATKNLLEGLGIDLSDKEQNMLSKVNNAENSSVQNLAKGVAAEKSDNLIDALVFYSKAEKEGSTEATSSINSIFGRDSFSEEGIQNIRAKMDYAKQQEERWIKIFTELNLYVKHNGSIIVYDFSKTEVNLNYSAEKIDFNLKPGIKVVPDRNVLLVCQRILREWEKIADNEKDNSWVRNVELKVANKFDGYYNLYVRNKDIPYSWYSINPHRKSIKIGIYNDSGYRIKELTVILNTNLYELDNLKSQRDYFNEDFRTVEFSLSINDLPEQGNITYKVTDAFNLYFRGDFNLDGDDARIERIMSIDEYNEWVKNQ